MNFTTTYSGSVVPNHPAMANCEELIRGGGIRCISFDFFDTLVVRSCEEPSDLFVELGARLRNAGLETAADGFAADEFRGIRREAERLARLDARSSGREGEIHLDEVYDLLFRRRCKDPQERRRLIDKAVECEIETEQDFLALCPSVKPLLELCRRESLPYVITSDTYFSAEQLGRLLDSVNGQLAREDRIQPQAIFTSADVGTSKPRDLFPRVLDELDVPASSLLSIGDNYQADVARPKFLGLSAVYFERYRPDQEEVLAMESRYRPALPANDYFVRAARSLADVNGDADPAHSYGAFVLGPVYSGFIFHLLDLFRSGQVDRFLFLTREGAFLRELADLVAEAGGLSLPADLFQVLPVSRLATHRCTIEAIDEALLTSLRNDGRPLTMAEAVEFLLPETDPIAELSSCQQKLLNDEAAARQLLEALEKTKNLTRSLDYAREQRRLLVECFEELAGDAKRIALVDVGWQGQMQRHLSRALELEDARRDLLGAYMMLGGRYGEFAVRDNLEMNSFLPVSPLNDNFRDSIYRAPLVLELAAMPEFGTTLRYEKRDGRAAAVSDALVADTVPAEIRRIQTGIRDFLLTYINTGGGVPDDPRAIRSFAQRSQEILLRAILRPEDRELGVWRKVYQEEHFGTRKPFLDSGRKQRFSGLTFKEIQALGDIPWPAAMIREMDPECAAAYEEFELTMRGQHTRVLAKKTWTGGIRYLLRAFPGPATREKLRSALPALARKFPFLKRLSPGVKSVVLRVLGASGR